jgi:hypothetical protein
MGSFEPGNGPEGAAFPPIPTSASEHAQSYRLKLTAFVGMLLVAWGILMLFLWAVRMGVALSAGRI